MILCLLLVSLPLLSEAQETTGTQAKRVMFRDDDVASLSDALRAVNQVHIDEGVPVTLGVIPARSFPSQNATDFDLWNSPFAQYMRTLESTTLFEIAQHGWNHSNNSGRYNVSRASEFRGMPYDEQYGLIENGQGIIQKAFGFKPTTFIAPYNTGDENTLKALSALGYTVYSSYDGEFNNKHEGNLTHESTQLALTYDTNGTNFTYESFVNQTEKLLNDPHVKEIVIVYHNWAFTKNGGQSVDPAKVDALRFYIRYLKTQNVTFSTLNGTSPNLDLLSLLSNETQTGTEPAMLQRAGTEWIYVVLALTATGVVGTLAERKKSGK